MLLAITVAGSIYGLMATANAFASAAQAGEQAAAGTSSTPTGKGSTSKPSSAAQPSGATRSTAVVGSPMRYAPSPLSRRAEFYYDSIWGVDSLRVKSAEANEVIRFTYRVLDPQKAGPLNNEKNDPSLIDPKAGVSLVVPSLEKVGKLRQVSTPQSGKVYWMAFSNKGRLVKPGDRVNVVIGNFRANGLVVE
jgi:hypothetical protein